MRCKRRAEVVIAGGHERPVHTAAGIMNCPDSPHATAHPVKRAPEQREIVLRPCPDYPGCEFTADVGVLITASLTGVLTHLGEAADEELRARPDPHRSRKRWAGSDALARKEGQ